MKAGVGGEPEDVPLRAAGIPPDERAEPNPEGRFRMITSVERMRERRPIRLAPLIEPTPCRGSASLFSEEDARRRQLRPPALKSVSFSVAAWEARHRRPLSPCVSDTLRPFNPKTLNECWACRLLASHAHTIPSEPRGLVRGLRLRPRRVGLAARHGCAEPVGARFGVPYPGVPRHGLSHPAGRPGGLDPASRAEPRTEPCPGGFSRDWTELHPVGDNVHVRDSLRTRPVPRPRPPRVPPADGHPGRGTDGGHVRPPRTSLGGIQPP